MKKNIRGKRYLRSRASVEKGRMKKLFRKLNRYTRALIKACEVMNKYEGAILMRQIRGMMEKDHLTRIET